MKRFRLAYLLPIIVTSVTLFSCSNPVQEPVINIKKTVLRETVEDYVKNNYFQFSATPSKGDAKMLIIPIWFTDSTDIIDPEDKEEVREDIRIAYLGTNEETGWESVKTFYEKESQGAITMSGTVSEWYEAGTMYSYGTDSGYKTAKLVKDASDSYFLNHPTESRQDYDGDGDGYLDGVVLIYAAPDSSQRGYGSYGNFWAYTSWLESLPNKEFPQPNVFFWSSYDFMYDEDTALDKLFNRFARGDNRYCNIDSHTFIHETGHMFGLPDYYDYDGAYSFAGSFSMQDYNVGGHDPYSVMSLGWANPYIPTTEGEITIKSFQQTHDLILLTPSWNKHNSAFDEYILLELYTPEGLNEFDSTNRYMGRYPLGPNATGLRVWHVDARLVNVLNNQVVMTTKGGNVYFGANNNSSSYDFPSFKNYNLLQLIRNDTKEKKETATSLSEKHLFKQGDSFSLEKFDKQFNGTGKLDKKKALGWTFSVKSIFLDENGIATAKISLKNAQA